MVGYHFRFDLRLNWEGLVSVFDERAKLLGCPPPGASLKPYAARAVVSGTVDERLRRGGFRYDIVLHDSFQRIAGLELAHTNETIQVRFGVHRESPATWCSSDTLGLSSIGLFVPEQRTADGTRTLPADFVARIDLWDTLSRVAKIAAGDPVPETRVLPGAPGWSYEGESGDPGPSLVHAVAGLNYTITPMEF